VKISSWIYIFFFLIVNLFLPCLFFSRRTKHWLSFFELCYWENHPVLLFRSSGFMGVAGPVRVLHLTVQNDCSFTRLYEKMSAFDSMSTNARLALEKARKVFLGIFPSGLNRSQYSGPERNLS
jgi:hypothetical protein